MIATISPTMLADLRKKGEKLTVEPGLPHGHARFVKAGFPAVVGRCRAGIPIPTPSMETSS